MDFAAEPWDYLAASEAIDIEHPLVQSIASELRTGDDVAYARAAFDHVRDRVAHSMDVSDPRVPWRASDVLEQRVGLCYAKSHAYVALLRAGGVQAGLCYQTVSGVLHGLTAALVDDRWVLLDPRGNNANVDVEFSASEDRLAYPEIPVHPTVHATPHPTVLAALRSMRTLDPDALPTSL
ncbi:transglutaminase family protein [Actinomadura sp. WMMB 499]|uniref:transglutaminase-like domain-containing protein n=1 Tax=Actinomadura sp. WMMB 499 TaxID=1219491 RepID=UPI001248229E|nr:transglutaminase family protein [Actinomadura sp. WMMB 499]QFG25573.1 transglutaminase family protein [Actinomadura sp. WMMB 499]